MRIMTYEVKVTKTSLHNRSLKYGKQQHFILERCLSVVFCNDTLIKLGSMLSFLFSVWGK